jgi:hypothetical protein
MLDYGLQQVHHRFASAVTLLCKGRKPPAGLVAGWLDRSDDGLQEFAIDNGPAWAQGIALLDAAKALADSPVEGVSHEAAAPVQAPSVPPGFLLVPEDTIRNAAGSIGCFVSDEGWKEEDMDNLDALTSLLAARPTQPTDTDTEGKTS